jgi:hypothetical protein
VLVAREELPEPVRLTCRSAREETAPSYRTLAIERLA